MAVVLPLAQEGNSRPAEQPLQPPALSHLSPPPQGLREPADGCQPENLGWQAREFWEIAAS